MDISIAEMKVLLKSTDEKEIEALKATIRAREEGQHDA